MDPSDQQKLDLLHAAATELWIGPESDHVLVQVAFHAVLAWLRGVTSTPRGVLATFSQPAGPLAQQLGFIGSLLHDPETPWPAEPPRLWRWVAKAASAAAAALMATISELHAEAERGASTIALLDRALDRSGYGAWLEQHPDGTRRLRTLARLRVLAQRAELPLSEWLDALALGDESAPVEDEVVHLSSVHQAKGKEFRATFSVGLEEGLVPHYRAIRGTDAGEAALEEELRVLYVALPRARERLYLSACRERTRGSQTERRQPSRWLSALPSELLAQQPESERSRLSSPPRETLSPPDLRTPAHRCLSPSTRRG